jgi:hypothetical protein
MVLQQWQWLAHFVYPHVSPSQTGILDSLPLHHKKNYARDFRLVDEGYYAGRVAATTKNRATHWGHWTNYVRPLGLDPYLQRNGYTMRVRVLTGFAARVRRGAYGWGKRVQAGTVVGALTAVGQEIALACGENPTKVLGSDKILPRLQQIYDGWRKEDPATTKQLPVEADVPECLAEWGQQHSAKELDRAVGDLTLVAFYYLLRIGEYTIKGNRNETKQMVQFKREDITFFKKNRRGQLRCLPRDAADDLIATADGATLKLDNQKNGWKGVCVYQEANGDWYNCPVWALGCQYLHLRMHGASAKTFLSTYWIDRVRLDVTAENISRALKSAAAELQYPTTKGIPIERINTHSLRSGGANALALAGYSDTQIQKMGRWRGATFKEYIREELAATGMSKDMKRKFNFINIAGNAFTDINEDTLHIIEFDV